MVRTVARPQSRALRAHWRGVVRRNFPHLHPEVKDAVLAVLGLDLFDDLGLMKASNRKVGRAASLVDIWNSTRQAPSVGHLEAESQRLQPLYGSELTAVLAASDVLEDLRAAVTLLRQRKNGRAPRVVTPAPSRRPVSNRAAAPARAKRLAEEAVESEWRRRQEVRERRELRRESDEILSPETSVEVEEDRPVCAGCYQAIETNVAYTDRAGDGPMCRSCARIIYGDLRSEGAVARRVSLVPAVEVVEVVPVAPETVVAEVIETVADPVRDELLRLVNLDATRRRLTQGQLDEVRMVFDRGEFARSVKMLRQMLAASVSVARPKFPTATYTCKRCEKTIEGADAFKIVWQWRKDGEDLVPDALADIDIFEKYVKDGPQPLCGSCGREARELVLKLRNRHGWKSNPYWTHRFLDQPSQPPTPPLERPPEPLTAKAEERVVQTAAATATA